MRHKRGSTLGVFQRDLCVRQDSAARIFYGPHDAAGILLRPCRTGQADIQGKTQDKKEENAMAEASSRHDDAPQLCGLALASAVDLLPENRRDDLWVLRRAALFAYIYEQLLLVSIWCVCQEKLTQ